MFLVQKRSKSKEYCPSYLDLTIGGVVTLGEEDIRKVLIVFIKLKLVCYT